MSYKFILILWSVFIIQPKWAAEAAPIKCKYEACGKFKIVSTNKIKARCVAPTDLYGLKAGTDLKDYPLVETKNCALHVTQLKDGKTTHYAVTAGSKICSAKAGDTVTMNLIRPRLKASSGYEGPCAKGILSLRDLKLNPTIVVDEKKLKGLIDFESIDK